MSEQNPETKKMVATAGTCAVVGGGAAVAVAAAVSAPITLPIVLIGGAIGCIGGALISSLKKENKVKQFHCVAFCQSDAIPLRQIKQ